MFVYDTFVNNKIYTLYENDDKKLIKYFDNRNFNNLFRLNNSFYRSHTNTNLIKYSNFVLYYSKL